jgi:hypothetical protein
MVGKIDDEADPGDGTGNLSRTAAYLAENGHRLGENHGRFLRSNGM